MVGTQEIKLKMRSAMTDKESMVDAIIKYEQGELGPDEEVELFAHLIKTGQAWSLQGHYGRTAVAMIQAGLVNPEGDIQ